MYPLDFVCVKCITMYVDNELANLLWTYHTPVLVFHRDVTGCVRLSVYYLHPDM